MNRRERFLHRLSNPNVIYILFLVGLYGLIFELASPGAILPGVAGAIAVLLALMGFEALPISLTGVLLLVLGAALLILELFIVSHGILAVGGFVSLVLGSLMVFPAESPAFRVAAPVMAGMLTTTGAFVVLVLWVLVRSRKKGRAISGVESLVGARGVVRARTAGEVLIHVQGEDWLATTDAGDLEIGQAVEVVAVEGLRVKVRKEASAEDAER